MIVMANSQTTFLLYSGVCVQSCRQIILSSTFGDGDLQGNTIPMCVHRNTMSGGKYIYNINWN